MLLPMGDTSLTILNIFSKSSLQWLLYFTLPYFVGGLRQTAYVTSGCAKIKIVSALGLLPHHHRRFEWGYM